MRRRARGGLLWYFAILIPLTAILDWIIIAGGAEIAALLLVWLPAISAIAARLTRREGVADVSFRLGGYRGWLAIVLGVLFPVVIGGIAYGVAWATGLARYDPSAGFPILLLQAVTIGTVINVITTAGEELGWRGYMLTRLIDADVPRPILVSGLIWGVWYLPLILAGLYDVGPDRLVSAVLFLVAAAALGYPFAWMRLRTGSIWPPIILHAAWNAVIRDTFDKATVGPNSLLWNGETGILVVALLLVVAVALGRREWPTRQLSAPPAPGADDVEQSARA